MIRKYLLSLVKIYFFFSGTCFLNAQINTFPYVEDFEVDTGGWTSGGTNSSWDRYYLNPYFMDPSAKLTYAPFGNSAWKTGEVNYNNNEASWVQSPVFDLSSLSTPHIQLKIWYDCQTDVDGAVLQSSTDSGVSWQNVGNIGEGTNWFNKTSISSNPGNQSKGWSGAYDDFDPNLSEESKGWETAIFPISNLVTNNVIFRIAFSSDSSTNGPGFAFDYVQISNSSCYIGDNIKPTTVYNITDIDDLNNFLLITGKNINSKQLLRKKFRFKRGPKKIFVKDDGLVDFPNTGTGFYEEYVFEYWDETISCNGLKDIGFIIVKVGGNDYGGTDIVEEGCYITDVNGVQLFEILYDALSLEAIRCRDELYLGTWYEINGNVETEVPATTRTSQGTYKYVGCSNNSAIINITTENNCNSKDLYFTFDNAEKTFDGTDYFFEVDVMIQTKHTGTFKLGSGQLSFNYNTEAFGENINTNGNFEVITDGGIVSQPIDSDPNTAIYNNFNEYDNSTSVVSWSYSQKYGSSSFANDNVTGVPTKLCHLKIKYQDETKDPAFLFETGYPLDNQFSTACGEQAGDSSGYAYCTGEPGFLIRNDEFNSYISEITLFLGKDKLIDLSVYPNPAKEIIFITSGVTIDRVEMYDMIGKQVLTTKETSEVNVNHLQKGLYLLKLYSKNASTTKKVIIR